MRLPKPLMVLSLLVAVALPLRAQSGASVPSDSVRSPSDSAQTTIATEPTESAKGASLIGLRAGVHARETAAVDRPAMAAAAARGSLGQARAMMVVGVAALIAGAIIGGDAGTIIMVGGTVIGLIGLYDYLQ